MTGNFSWRSSCSSAIIGKRKTSSDGIRMKRTSCIIANGWNNFSGKQRPMTVKIGNCSHTGYGVGSKRRSDSVDIGNVRKKSGGGTR